jgi:hypothetical protein
MAINSRRVRWLLSTNEVLPPPPQPTVRQRMDEVVRGAQTKYFLYGASKNHDHYGLSIFCMDKR